MSQSGGMAMCDCEERLEALEEEVQELRQTTQSVNDDHDSRYNHVIKPRLNDLKEASDDAREERAELGATVQELQTTVAQQQARLKLMAGVDDETQSSPEKRVEDIRDAMIDRADARGESGSYSRIKLWRKEIEDLLVDRGHGSWSKPVYQKAMKKAAEAPGFEMAKKVNEDGREVMAVAVDTEVLREEIGSSDPTTGKGVSPAQNGGETPITATQD